MENIKITRLLFLKLFSLWSVITIAQTGPGGIGNNSGTSNLVLWLKADEGVLNGSSNTATNGEAVSIWRDQSGYGYDAVTAATSPIFTNSNTNFKNLPTITFAGGATEFLFIEDDADQAPQLDNTTEISIFYVFNETDIGGLNGHLSKRDGNGDAQSYVTYENGAINSRINSNNDAGQTILANTTYINAITYENGNFDHFLNQLSGGGNSGGTASIPNNNSDLHIGTLNSGDGRNFNGNFAEIVVFKEYLTNAQRIVVETYLSSKYGISVSSDFWDETTYATYDNEIAGIGQHTDGTIANNATSSVLTISGGSERVNDEWVFWGHDNGDFSSFTTSEVITGSGYQRLAREWVVNETNDLGDVSVSIKSSDIPGGITNPNVYLMVDTDGDASFEDATSYAMLPVGDGFSVDVNLSDGDHLALSFEEGDPFEVWYSYVSGNWNSPSTWTLDGAISALYVNPEGKIPSKGDSVVVNSGRSIYMDVNDVEITRLEVVGTLDLNSSTGHTFSEFLGSGTISLSGSGGIENYPSGSDEQFYDPDEGGILELYGTAIELNTKRKVNNLILNLTNPTDVALMTGDSLIVNGNMTINSGFFQINNNTETNNLVVEINEDLFVGVYGGIDVGSANARHELNLYGNFTNQGDVDFTNRTSQITGSEAIDGIVDVNFVSPSKDQIVLLQNTTDFYRIEINKGLDDTYIVDISADDPNFFNLFGYAGLSTNASQQTTNANALGLIFGTVKVGNNVTISPLNSTGNYSVYEGAQIWVDGGTVEKVAGTAIVPYGKLRVSGGALNAPINSGITTRDNGQLTIEAGTVTVNQFRTSINGVSAQGGLIMTGGIFNITGGSTSTSYYTFSLTYSGNVFIMSGGTINISGANSKGGVYINSSEENINVTGGTVNLNVSNNNNLTVTSRAPFYNLNVLKSTGSGSGTVRVSSGSSGSGAGETTLLPSRLSIINDLKIDNSLGNNTRFDANDFDVNIVGALIVENGSVVDLTGMELTFEGAGSSALDIQTGATLTLDTLIINKNLFETALKIDNGASNAVTVNNLLNVQNGKFDLQTFDVTVNGAINILDTIGVSENTGLIYMNGGSTQTITSSSGMIYDLEIDNTSGVSLSGDFAVDTLTLDAGLFDINTFKLTSNVEIQTNGIFDNSMMIQTDGDASDGGLEYYFDGATADPIAVLFPIGTDANGTVRFTPASLDLSSIAAADDGYVRVNPVDSELTTTDLNGGNILSYHWKVNHRAFGPLPTAEYSFTYATSDDDASDEANYVPGKVLDESPYTRSSEIQSNLNTGTNVITFDANDGGGFVLENANYTGGIAARFTGEPLVYYTKGRDRFNTQPLWTSSNTWTRSDQIGFDSNNPHISTNPDSPDTPGAGDIAVIGFFPFDDPQTTYRGYPHSARINSGDLEAAKLIFTQMTDELGNSPVVSRPISDLGGPNDFQFRPTLTWNSTGTILIDEMEGEGTIRVRGGSSNDNQRDPSFANTDLGLFVSQDSSALLYEAFNDFTLSNIPDELPSLIITNDGWGANNRTITVDKGFVTNQNLELQGNSNLVLGDGGGNITVRGNVFLRPLSNNTGGGELRFSNSGISKAVTIEGNLYIGNPNGTAATGGSVVRVVPGGSAQHSLNVSGDIVVNTTGDNTEVAGNGIIFGSDSESYVDLILAGLGDHEFNVLSANTPEFHRIVMDKGTDTTNTFTLRSNFILTGDNSSDTPPLKLLKGKLVINAIVVLELANGIDYNIPSGAGLEVTQGIITSIGSNIILDGLFKVNGGTVDLESTDIIYSTTGSALIEVTSGILNVGGQIRRATTSTSGVLKYRQTGGDVDIATDAATTTSRASFEVLNSGSEFTLTGGTFNIARGVSGDTNESLELDPDSYDLNGSTITIFENLLSDYGSNFFNIKSAIPLGNLTIANTVNLPDVRAFVQPLTTNNLTINSNQVVLANDLDVTIKGDFINSGNYISNSSATIFNSDASQAISGSGTFTLFDLTKIGSGMTISSVNLSLINDLRVLEGTFDLGANNINLMNDAYIESTLANTAGNGLVFSGASGQNLYGKSNEIVELGTITISNSNGVDIPDGNGFDFNITENLRLAGGVFNIGGSLVTMKEGSTITSVSPFGINNMIQTNSSFTDNGFVIEFLGIDADTTIFYPVGELKYTPVSFDINAGATSGSIRVRPANERHPTITNNDETILVPSQVEIDDTQNSLQYYWVVIATGTTSFQGEATFFYNHDDIIALESDTSNFISGRLLSNTNTWDKFLPTDFHGANQSFNVPLGSGVTFAQISGDYTAGLGSSNGMTNDIEGALPDQLAEYETDFTGSSNYSAASSWNPLNGSSVVDEGIGPLGARVIVRNGDNLTLDISGIRLYSTEIEAGGTITIPSGVNSVRLGNVSGSGTILLNNTELMPTGEYSSFFTCDGGILQYSGLTSYNVLSGVSQVRKVIFDGSGTRNMPNNALNVCDSLIIDGPTVSFTSGQTYTVGDVDTDRLEIQTGGITISNGSTLDINGDLIISAGSFTGSDNTNIFISDDLSYLSGVLNWNGSNVSFDGSTSQNIDGEFSGISAFKDVSIDNTSITGITIVSGGVEIVGNLTFIDGLVNTTSNETLTLTSTGVWSGAGTSSYVNGPISKRSINAITDFSFPIGKIERYAPVTIVNVGTGGQNWTAEYFTNMDIYPAGSFDNSDPGSGFNPIENIKSTDRWAVESSGTNTSQVRVTYGSHNSYSNINDIRVALWSSSNARWENQGGIVSGSLSSGTSTSENDIHFSQNQFALAEAPESSLPVILLFFQAELKNDYVKLTWQTGTEIDNSHFDVEKSVDGEIFDKIGEVKGSGTTSDIIDYDFKDSELSFGLIYYRLKQVDYDYNFEYSPIIFVMNENKSPFRASIYPNPSTLKEIKVKWWSNDQLSPIKYRIVGLDGRVYINYVIEKNDFSSSFGIENDLALEQGVYLLYITQGKHSQVLRMILKN